MARRRRSKCGSTICLWHEAPIRSMRRGAQEHIYVYPARRRRQHHRAIRRRRHRRAIAERAEQCPRPLSQGHRPRRAGQRRAAQHAAYPPARRQRRDQSHGAGGAQDPELLDDARANAPLRVLTLERVVSLTDYEDFARAFGGIAKALATWTWDKHSRGVLVTVAGPNGAAVDAASATFQQSARGHAQRPAIRSSTCA